eukprot:s5935_g6.t1
MAVLVLSGAGAAGAPLLVFDVEVEVGSVVVVVAVVAVVPLPLRLLVLVLVLLLVLVPVLLLLLLLLLVCKGAPFQAEAPLAGGLMQRTPGAGPCHRHGARLDPVLPGRGVLFALFIREVIGALTPKINLAAGLDELFLGFVPRSALDLPGLAARLRFSTPAQSKEEFIKACGEVNLWRQRANDLADEECKKYTSTLDIADREAGGIATADAQHRRMIEHLARRGQAMLRACGKDQPPVYAALGIIKPPAKGGSA